MPSREVGGGQFVLDAYKVRPRLNHEFSGTEKLGIYLQIYNLTLDELTHKSKVTIAYRITKGDEELWHSVEPETEVQQGREQLTIQRFIPVNSLPPGRYAIKVTAIDTLSSQTVTRDSEFTVKAVTTKPGVSPRRF